MSRSASGLTRKTLYFSTQDMDRIHRDANQRGITFSEQLRRIIYYYYLAERQNTTSPPPYKTHYPTEK